MSEIYTLPLPTNPNVLLYSRSPDYKTADNLVAIDHGNARVAVHAVNKKSIGLDPEQVVYSAMAALGMSNTKIGDACETSFRKVQSQLDEVFAKIHVNRRPQLGRTLLETGFWEVTTPGSPLKLSDVQIPILEKVTEGLTDIEIADELHYTPSNVHAHIVRIGHRTGWKRREPITLAAMLSGEIGNIALPATVSLEQNQHSTH